MTVEIVPRSPTPEEFTAITAAVGFKAHDPQAIVLGLARSVFAVCAVEGGEAIGCGRVLGDGALHFYLANVMVVPACQRRGIGTRLVAALCEMVRAVPYRNTLMEVSPLPGLEAFYGKFGFRASRRYAPCMHLWLNPQDP